MLQIIDGKFFFQDSLVNELKAHLSMDESSQRDEIPFAAPVLVYDGAECNSYRPLTIRLSIVKSPSQLYTLEIDADSGFLLF